MVERVLDKNWTAEGKSFGKAQSDHNTYTAGAIGRYNIILAYMPGAGGNSATGVASAIRSSFPSIEIVLVVGVCGVVPVHLDTKDEIVLGDTIISTGVVQYDYGRRYPGKFARKIGIEDSVGRAPLLVRTLIAKHKASHNYDRLLQRHIALLEELNKAHSCAYPGTETDHLFESTYLHTHHDSVACADCIEGTDICTRSCTSLGCNLSHTIQRKRFQINTESVPSPRIHFGCYGSANTVLKSGSDRDELAKEHHLIAFEMEGAGIWDTFPTIIVKSACDYADSHKNKQWQEYAAATAATAMKALLETLELPDRDTSEDNATSILLAQLTLERRDPVERSDKKPIRIIPFTRDKDFTGREEIVQKLLDGIEQQAPTYQLRAALVGMGGVGKSQIAIEFAYQLQKLKP